MSNTIHDLLIEAINLQSANNNEEAIALMLQLLSQNQKIEGGSSDIEYNVENSQSF